MNHNILGLIGGIGPESTVEYYKLIIKNYRDKADNNEYPEFFINNINMTQMLGYIKDSKLDQLTDYLVNEINKLIQAGANFIALASNTPHIVYKNIISKIKIPIISIVEETFKEISKHKITCVGLFGTISTMENGFYQQSGRDKSIEVITPNKELREYINKVYFEELVLGKINNNTKTNLLNIIQDMVANNGIEGLILGGTELPLILNKNDYKDIYMFNTTQIHVNSIVDKMLAS